MLTPKPLQFNSLLCCEGFTILNAQAQLLFEFLFTLAKVGDIFGNPIEILGESCTLQISHLLADQCHILVDCVDDFDEVLRTHLTTG